MNELLTVFLSALTPLGELRLAIPLGVGSFRLPVWEVYIVAVAGNMLPPIIILWLFPKFSQWLRQRSRIMDRFLTWLFLRTRKKMERLSQRYGDIALIIFVAIPLPNTGAWTGALAAWLFGIPFVRSVINIFIGVLIAGLIVTLLTTGLAGLL